MTTAPTGYRATGRAKASNGGDSARMDTVTIAVTRHVDLLAEPVQAGPERAVVAIVRRRRGGGLRDRRED